MVLKDALEALTIPAAFLGAAFLWTLKARTSHRQAKSREDAAVTRVLVTGGAGYIGSHTVLMLLNAQWEVVVVDNLVNSSEESLRRVAALTNGGDRLKFVQCDLCDKAALEKVFVEYGGFRACIHFAGLKAVGESVSKPLYYYENNLVGTLNLLNAMKRHGTNIFIFSSSATVYGNAPSPMTEDTPVGQGITNPYGQTKYMIERFLEDFQHSPEGRNWKVVILRYFNPVGAHESGRIGEDPSGTPNNLMPYVSQVAVGRRPHLTVFGGDYNTVDGTGVRDYIHVMDLSEGHLAALDYAKSKGPQGGYFVFNLGTGKGYSVLEMVKAMEKASGRTIKYIIGDRRPGDLDKVYSDPSKAKRELGWEATRGLDEMVAWFSSRILASEAESKKRIIKSCDHMGGKMPHTTATVSSQAASEPTVELELDHAVAYSPVQEALHYHPNGINYIHTIGAAVVINSLADTHKQEFLRGHDDTITCLTISRSGRLLASGQKGRNSDVCVWDFEGRRLLFRLAEHDFGVAAVGFSDDELLLATAGFSDDKKLIIWDTKTGHIVTSVTLTPNPTTALTWAGFVKDIKRRETHRYLLCTAGAHQIVHWSIDARTGDIQADKIVADGRVTMVRQVSCVTFTDDREVMFVGTTTGDFAVVVTKERKMRRTVTCCQSGVLSILSWPGWLLVGGGDGSLSVFDMGQLVKQRHVDLKGGVVGLSPSPDRLEVIAGTSTGLVYRIRVDLTGETPNLSPLLVCDNHSAPVRAVQYAKDVSDSFATLSDDCSIRIWDGSDYSVLTNVQVRDAGKPQCLVYSLDLLITGWQDGQVRAFDSDTGRALWTIPNAHKAGVTAIALSHNQRFILTGGSEGDVRLWELRSRDLVSHLKGHHLPVTSIVIYGDDQHAVSVSLDRSIICWDLRTEKRVSTHLQRMGGVNRVDLSPDESLVITAGQEKRLTFWDLREHEPVNYRELSPDSSDEARSVALSPDGQLVVSGGTGQAIKLWDLGKLKLLSTGVGHSAAVNDVKFSPDGKQIVSVGDDGAIFVWNVYRD